MVHAGCELLISYNKAQIFSMANGWKVNLRCLLTWNVEVTLHRTQKVWKDIAIPSFCGFMYVEDEVGVVGVETGAAAAEVEDPGEDEDK